jgi:hypothetical protein
MSIRILVAITIAIAAALAAAIKLLDPERLSALGSIVSGGGSLLAVLWFSAGLRYQANQLEEQRKQFTTQFHYLQESSRRDALLMAKGILEKAEERAIAFNGKISSVGEILTEFTQFGDLKPILESTNPSEVLRAHALWIRKEGPASMLMQGIKSAAEVYLRSVSTPGIDYTKPADEFYMIYSPHFDSLPFFESLAGVATMLSEFMVRLSPGRNAATIAFLAATSKSLTPEIVKMDKLRADIVKHVANGYPLPAIAREL